MVRDRATLNDVSALERGLVGEVDSLTSRMNALRLWSILDATTEIQTLVGDSTKDMRQDLARLLQVHEGEFWDDHGAYTGLHTMEDARAAIDAESISNGWHVMSNLHTDLARAKAPTVNQLNFTQELLLQSKTQRTGVDVTVDSSFQTVMPSQLATVDGKLKAKNFLDWNKGDGRGGGWLIF